MQTRSDRKCFLKGNANLALLWYFVLLWEVFPRSKQIGFVLKAVLMGGSRVWELRCDSVPLYA